MWRVIPKLNQVILVIILAEFVFTVAAGLITPFLSVFILEDIRGATVAVVGFATALYWVTKSLLQFPIARYLDRNHGEIDDYYSMLIGTGLVVAAVYAYYFASEVWHVFALQFLIAVGDAFIVPPFYAIFTRHIDSDSVGFEWALRSGFSIGAASALGGAVSGILAATIGIRPIFLINGTLMFIGLVVLLFLKPYIRPKAPAPVRRVFIEQKRV